ncbi:hypothetical protein BM525_18665 (plasmid) [Alteromonas mediterranea]|uniref:Uncharacterized protein n=1 Tax=Alteromonas mediterranea TaxID=314275 RepID=A0AAC9NSQ1_9ALTE|nr:hypothetical protein [Alteromonas mediterranea]APD91905.1 hypothetical protein BM524_18470 [Alteromonas mediterranea]APD99759.1 hypothetical protein BM525_18665 [Alteromonas mediterranea]
MSKGMEALDDASYYKSKLTALLGVVLGAFLVYTSYQHTQAALDYRPLPQQVFLDTYNRPLGEQNLALPANHNHGFRKTTSLAKGETAIDFAHYALVDMFDYNADELNEGQVFHKFQKYLYEKVATKLYRTVFINLGQQRIVKAQEALVRGRVIGDLQISQPKMLDYQTTSGVFIKARTFLVTGTFMVTVHADKDYPTVYNVRLIVQRALVQDKMMGYQIISMELK